MFICISGIACECTQRKKQARVVEKKLSDPLQPLDPHAENLNDCKPVKRGNSIAHVHVPRCPSHRVFCICIVLVWRIGSGFSFFSSFTTNLASVLYTCTLHLYMSCIHV